MESMNESVKMAAPRLFLFSGCAVLAGVDFIFAMELPDLVALNAN